MVIKFQLSILFQKDDYLDGSKKLFKFSFKLRLFFQPNFHKHKL